MAYVAIADRDHEHALHDPQTFIRKYIWSQDHKVIAIQYAIVAIAHRPGRAGDVGADAPAARLSRHVLAHRAAGLLPVHHHARHDHGDLPADRAVPRRLRQLPHSADVRLAGHGVPVHEHAELLVLPARRAGAGRGIVRAGRPDRRGLDALSAAGDSARHAGRDAGASSACSRRSAIFIVAFTMGGLNYVTTVLQARCRGMTLMRMPLSVWGIFMASILGLLAFPALFVSAIMMTLDSLVGTSFFMPAVASMGERPEHSGGSPLLFQHLFWFFGHPEVYIVALPAFGIVSDLLSTHARRNIFGYRMMVWAILAIGCLSFVVWAHHMYVSGMNPYFGFFFATTTLIIAVPTAIKVYNWVLTIWRGDVHLTVPMLFAIGFIFTFINGGLTGLFLGNVTVDVPLSGTYFVVAHFHMVMGVSPILVVFGAIYHWYPKITGRMLDERLGKIHFWCTFLGTYAIYLPMHYLGILGVPRRYYAYSDAIEFIPPVGAHRERVDHDLGAVRRRRAAGVPVQPHLVVLPRSRRRVRIHGARRRSNGRRPIRRRSTATGARICRSCIAGPTTTACRARRRTSFRRTCRRRCARSPAGREHGVHDVSLTVAYRRAASPASSSGCCWSASCATKSWEPQLRRRCRGGPTKHRIAPARVGLWVFLARRHVAVRPVHLRVLHAHGHGHGADRDRTGSRFPSRRSSGSTRLLLICGSVAMQWARRAVAQRRCDADRDGAVARRPADARLPGRPVLRLARAAIMSELFSPQQSGGRVLLPADRRAWPAPARRPVRVGTHAARACARQQRRRSCIDVRLSVELCTVYWHYLLLVWLVLVRGAAVHLSRQSSSS